MDKIIDDATMNWLLEKENPSVRYHALTTLLCVGESDPEVVQARRAIMESGIVPEILEKQTSGGYWGDEKRFYLDKYSGTVWQLMILAELAADPGHAHAKCDGNRSRKTERGKQMVHGKCIQREDAVRYGKEGGQFKVADPEGCQGAETLVLGH
jgi:hypothetical protein